MSKRVLITGGAGFVGSYIVRACLENDWRVGVMYQPESGLTQIQDVLEQLSLFPVFGRSSEVFEVVERFKPDLVFHLASVFISEHKPEDVHSLILSNVAFGAQVLESMKKFKVKYMVNVGTAWQHYHDDSYNPVNLYASTKQAFEDILKYYVEDSIQAITLKLFDTYGPFDPRLKLVNLLHRAAREKIQIDMSPGEQLINIVYIDDVIEAFMISAQLLFSGKVHKHETFVVRANEPIRLRDLVELYEEIVQQKLDIKWGGRPYRSREVMVPWRGGNLLPGWQQRTSLAAGIKKSIATVQNKKTPPLVTVCIPVYNEEKYIAQAIDSVLSQTFTDLEILIVDNASTDKTLDVIAGYTDKRVRLLRNSANLGLEANWNRAIMEAKGKYIKLLPADDFLYANCIERQVSIFQDTKNTNLLLVSCARDVVDPTGKSLITRKFPGNERKVDGVTAIRKVLRSGTNLLGEPGAILFKRSILEKTGTFDGSLSYVIDIHLWLRMLLHGDLYVISEPLCAFRLSSGSTSLELATLQSKHFITFINNLNSDPHFDIRWIDQYTGIFMSRLLGLMRKVFYILTVDMDTSDV